MIQISKDEAKLIRKQLPNVPLKRTVHKYYVEESPIVLTLIGRAPRHKDVRHFAGQKTKRK